MRLLSLYGKIVTFKSPVRSKIIYIVSMSKIPKEIGKLIEKIHSDFIWDKKWPNIKHSTLIGDDSKGGLKDIDILSRFKSLHLFWLKRLFGENYHPWKLIPLHYINIVSSDTLVFLQNLDILLIVSKMFQISTKILSSTDAKYLYLHLKHP